ncbi:hypothetical protein, partial [Salmonella enterica]|uniref:hypothetical protein n=1 Tax=Salmonella enterica TaxID=28901 RepID=UPI003298C58C
NEEETKTGGERDNMEEKHEHLTNMRSLQAPISQLQSIKEESKLNNQKQEEIQQIQLISSNDREENEEPVLSQVIATSNSNRSSSSSS